MYGVVPKPLWERDNPADARNRIAMTMRSLVLRDGSRTILVDAGVGHKDEAKFHEIFAIDFSEHDLTLGLNGLGVRPEDVTDVILTHLHFDHVGGAVEKDGDALRLVFPNATHYVQREHWNWGQQPSERDRASFMPDNYLPIADAGKLRLLDGEEELFPGIHMEIIHGHTFAQQLVRATEGDQSMLYVADLIPMSSHVPEPWIMGYDLQPIVTLREKQKVLERAVAMRDVLIYEHDVFSATSLVERTPKGYRASDKGSLQEALIAAGKGGSAIG
jgi:glyoxylase-like metal-dependent hydrolase (beta-lactamase superfamily II)